MIGMDKHRPYSYIDTDEQLQMLNEQMISAESIAIDMEADSLHHYYEKVCLIQMTIGRENFVVDPLAGMNMTGFLNILASKSLILHDAGYDLRMLRNSFGFVAEGVVFDTMLAAQLLGYERLSLVALIERFFDIALSKQDQKSNWSKRPLTADQLQYASDDTFYLHEIAETLHSELKRLDRLHWHKQACEKMIDSANLEKPPVDPDEVWRIKGSSRLDPLHLTLVRSIWQWRDQQARAADLPPFKVLGHHSILAIVHWAASNREDSVRNGPRLPRNCTGRRLRKLEDAVAQALNTPESEYAQPRKRKRTKHSPPDTQPVAEELRMRCQQIAEKLDVAPQLIATRAMIASVANHRPENIEEIMDCSGMMNWQAELMASAIEETLSQYPRCQ